MRTVPGFFKSLLALLVLVTSFSAHAAAPYDFDDGRLVYSNLTNPNGVKQVYYDQNGAVGSKWALDPSILSMPANSVIKHLQLRLSPRTSQALLGVQYATPAGPAEFKTLRFNGTSWVTSEQNLPVHGSAGSLYLPATATYPRAFGIAYEQRSGDALVIAAEGGTDGKATGIQPWYWTWSAATQAWAAPVAVPVSTVSSDAVRWVELYPRPGTDEILVAFQDFSNHLTVILWDGAGWKPLNPGTPLENSVTFGTRRPFDGAWEGQGSGRFLLAYVDSSGSDVDEPSGSRVLRYRLLDRNAPSGTSFTRENGLDVGQGAAPEMVALAADPASKRIAVTMVQGGTTNDVDGAVWDGSLVNTAVCDNGTTGCWVGATIPSGCSTGKCIIPGALSVLDDNVEATPPVGAFTVSTGWANGHAIATFAEKHSAGNPNSPGLDYAVWSAPPGAGNGWTANGSTFDCIDTLGGAAGSEMSLIVRPFHAGSALMWAATSEGLTTSDVDQQLFQASFDGSACANQSYATSDKLPLDGSPFDLQFNRFVQPTISIGGPLTIPAAAAAATTRSAPDITITEKGNVILKDDYLFVNIPSTSLSLLWVNDTPFAGVTYSLNGGPFNAVSGELYEPTYIDTDTIRFRVKRDLKANDAITIRGLRLTQYTTAKPINSATDRVTLELWPDTLGTNLLLQPSQSETVQIVESVFATDLGVKNALLKTGNITTDRELLKFSLKATGGNVTLQQLNFNVSFPGLLMNWSNVTRLDVYEAGTAAPIATKVGPLTGPADANFGSLARSIAKDATKTYTLTGRFTGLAAGHEMMVSLATGSSGGVEADGATSTYVGLKALGAITGGPISKTHRVSTYTIGALGGLTGGNVALGQTVTIPWAGVGDASVSLADVTLSYSVDNGTSWTAIVCVGGGTQNPCSWAIPTTIPPSQLNGAKIKIEGLTMAPDSQPLPLTGSTVESSPFTITELIALSDPPVPPSPLAQVKNALLDTDGNTLRDLLRFKLKATGAAVIVSQFTFSLAGSVGVSVADLSMVEIVDESGTNVALSVPPSAGSTLVVNVNPMVSTAGQVFTLKAKVGGLLASPPDSLSIQLNTASTSITGATGVRSGRDLTGVPGTRSGGPVSKVHQVSTYQFVSLSGLSNGKIALGQTLTNDWQALGDASSALADVILRYTVDNGTSWSAPISCANGGGTRDPCDWAIPTTLTASPLDGAKIKIEGKTQSDNQAIPPTGSNIVSGVFTVTETLTVSDPPAAPDPLQQVGNAFFDLDASTLRDLLRFKLGATGGAVAVTQLTFNLAGSNGVVAGDLSGVQIVDPSGTNIVTGTPPPPNGTTLIVNVNTSIASGASSVFTLKAKVANLVSPPSDMLVIALTDGSVSVTGATGQTSGRDLTGVPGARSGGPVSKTHTASTYVVEVPAAGSMVVVGTQQWGPGPTVIVPIKWVAYGDASLGDVTVSYRYFANSVWSAWADLCRFNDPLLPAPSGGGTCQAIVPDKVSTNVELRVTDNQKPVQTVSGSFVIGGIINVEGVGAYDLNGASAGGEAWIAGNDHTITWSQVGSFRTLLELSLDGGQNWTKSLGFKDVNAPVETTGIPYTYKVSLQDVTPNAKVRLRPEAAFSTMGNRESGLFTIAPAFSSIQPGGNSIFKNASTTLRWTPLPGTGPGSSPPPDGFPVSNVNVTVLDQSANIAFGPFTVGNTGSYGPWTPTAGGVGFRVKVCDASHPALNPAICVEGVSFNVVDSSVAITAVAPPAAGVNDFRLGNPATITWGGGLTGSFDLTLQQGTTTIRPITTINADSQASYTWPIPTDLTTPLTNVHIHMVSTTDSSVVADSALFTINGKLQNVALSATPVKLENAARDSTNDVTISWTALGVNQVKLFIKRENDPGFTPLSSFGAAGADDVTGTSYTWSNVADSAKTRQAVIRVAQLGNESAVYAETPTPFAVVGELNVTTPAVAGMSFDINDPAQIPVQLEWQTVRGVGVVHPVRVRVLDGNNQPIFEDPPAGSTDPNQVSNLVSPRTYTWTPVSTGKNLKVEVCDRNNLTICALSVPFNISGMSVSTDQPGYTVTTGTVPVTIRWRPVNGVNGKSTLAYRIGPTGSLVRIPDAATVFDSPDDQTQTFVWNVLRTFPDLSNQLEVVATDTGGSPQGSASISIQGAFSFTGPGPNPASLDGSYAAGNTVQIAWDTIGEIPKVALGWSLDGCVAQNNPISVSPSDPNANTPNGATAASWTIPPQAISNNLRFCLTDVTPGHVQTAAVSTTPIVVGAQFIFDNVALAGKRLVSNESQQVQWTTQGDVTQVKLELVYSYDNFVTFRVKEIVAATGNAGSYLWTITDLKNLLNSAGQALDPQKVHEVDVKLQLSDASGPGHPPVPQQSAAFTIRYYQVDWQVIDASTNAPLTGLQVVDDLRVGWSNAPQFDLTGSETHYYPYFQNLHTAWLLPSSQGSQDFSQGPDDAMPVQYWTSNKDQLRVVKLEVAASDAVTWNVRADYQYDTTLTPPQVEISTWLEKSGKIVDTFLDYAYAKIYSGGVLIKTLPQAAPESDGTAVNGRFKLIWDLTDSSNNSVQDDKTYFATIFIHRMGRDFSAGSALNIAVPKKILTGGTGGSGGSDLTQLQTDVNAIKDATVGPAATLAATIGGQITAAQTAIQSDISTSKGAIQTDIANSQAAISGQITGVQDTANLIKAETDKIQGVKAYLEDPNAGLPKVLSNQTAMQDQLKAQRRGGILNRALEVEKGKNAVIRYRAVDGAVAPKISVIDPSGVSVVISAPMAPAGSNLFEYSLAAALEGEYRVTVNEDASADSAGTLDGAMVTVVLPRATGQDLAGLNTKLDDLSTQLTDVGLNLDGKLNAISGAMATKAQVDSVIAKTDQLLAKWGINTADQIKTALDQIFAVVGLTAKSSELASLAKTTDLDPLAKSAELTPLAKEATLSGVATNVASFSGRFDAVDIALSNLQASVNALTGGSGGTGGSGSGGDLTSIQNMVSNIQTTMARDATVAKSSELAGLAKTTDLAALAQASQLVGLAKSSELAGLAKTTDLDPLARSAELAGLAQSSELTPLAKSSELALLAKDASVAAIDTKLGTPASALGISGDIAAISAATGAIDYTPKFAAIQGDLDLLKTAVSDPAQAAKLQTVQDAVDSIGTKITLLPTTTAADYSANFTAVSSALDALNTAVSALKADVASTQSSSDTAMLLTKLSDLEKEVQSAAGSSAAVGMAQGAYSAASEALKILQQVQTNLQQNGGSGNAQVPVLLGKFGEQMKQVSGNINVLPGQLSEDAEVLAQIKKLTEQAKGIASDKGYAFDSLYEMSKEQKGDVRTMRNQVEELKALVEMQRALLEKNMNQPVMKTWFEAR